MLSNIFSPTTEFILCISLSLVIIKEYGMILYKVLKKELDLIKEYRKLSLIGVFAAYGNTAFLRDSDLEGNYFRIAIILCTAGIAAVIAALWVIKRKSLAEKK